MPGVQKLRKFTCFGCKKKVELRRKPARVKYCSFRCVRKYHPKLSEESRKRQSDKMKILLSDPTKHSQWKGGVSKINARIRAKVDYKIWRSSVFERDNYTCQECGSRGVYLNADHIKPFAYFPELRLRIENGRTLCVPCHKKTDTYAGKCKQKYGAIYPRPTKPFFRICRVD